MWILCAAKPKFIFCFRGAYVASRHVYLALQNPSLFFCFRYAYNTSRCISFVLQNPSLNTVLNYLTLPLDVHPPFYNTLFCFIGYYIASTCVSSALQNLRLPLDVYPLRYKTQVYFLFPIPRPLSSSTSGEHLFPSVEQNRSNIRC